MKEMVSNMNRDSQPVSDADGERGSLAVLAMLSLLAGAAAGFTGASFRLSLDRADRLREALIPLAHVQGFVGFLLVVATCSGATAGAAWLVRSYAPLASGSGIPHVEAVLDDKLPAAPFRLIPVKFIGGLLAIGSGLALGREGPSVQMGATIAHLLGRFFRRNRSDCRVLLAAGAGAGLATAFNAPIAGAVFVLEELLRRFDTRVTMATFGASAGAIAVSRLLLGNGADFSVDPLPYPGFGMVPFFLALGVLAGILGVGYNRVLLRTLILADRLRRIPAELRAALIGASVGVLAWFVPDLIGGGDALTQRALAGTGSLVFLVLVVLFRFGFGAVSYAAATPGGLFAPMLVPGAQSGLIFGLVCVRLFPDLATEPVAFAIVGMAAFFTAVVRAPVTGIILVTEMTGSFTLLLPMLCSCFTAMLVPALLNDPPIYESLGERTLRSGEAARVPASPTN
jgi:CIC family chloride channel protein